ncbi:hypothetical protein AVEN_213843-1 [Araneus ventricosus]|uniref:Gem-associated protein 2 n=1 Tax=Araneus ventricosus TaxID=182803 RepID=A0A4Y2K0S1_ARAVE|nr:hypothetical protein AVEN_213843-1 [Araneus ventricosus]
MYCKLHKKHHHHHHYGCARKLPSPSSDSSSTSSSDSEVLSNAALFRRNAEVIKLRRSTLTEQFPKEIWLPGKNDMEWCAFCLGSKICQEIYGERTEGERTVYYRKLPYRRFPLLSIVLHLHQDKVKLLLHYLHQWLLIKGLKNVICMWLYALLACLDGSNVDEECDRFLVTLYKDLKRHLKSCEEWQKPRATLIMDILSDYFSADISISDSQ